MKFIVFFLLNLNLYTQNEVSKKFLDYIKYLSQRRIVENINIDQQESLTRGELIVTLYRLLKSIDKSKISKEDLNIIENMLYEITSSINDFKLELSESIRNEKQVKKDFIKLEDNLLGKIEKNLFKIDILEEKIKDQIRIEDSLKDFIKGYKINFSSDLSIINNLLDYKNLDFKLQLSTKISKDKNNFKIFYNKENTKDFNIVFRGELFPKECFSIYIKNYPHTFISPFKEIFYFDYLNYSKVIGVKSYNILDICIISNKALNLLANVDMKYLFLSSHFLIKNSIEYNFLEIGAKIPVFKETFWLGASLISQKEYFGNFYISYLSSFLNIKLYYKDNFDSNNREKKVKIYTNYIFSSNFNLGIRGVINFTNMEPTVENILESWEFYINTIKRNLYLNIFINSKKINNKNEISGILISELEYCNFRFRIGSILKDPMHNNFYRFCITLKGEYFLYKSLGIYVQYLKSNFKYHNDESNLEGKRYNIFFSKLRNVNEEYYYGVLSLGFKLNI